MTYPSVVHWRQQCAAVIPCLNEAVQIRPLVVKVRRHLDHVIVVNDGSTDGTASQAGMAGADLIHHPAPQGKGASLRDGWHRAKALGYEWALCLDGDGQHAPEDIPSFWDCAEKHQSKLVVGNRMHLPRGMPWLRRATNRFISGHLSRVAGIPLPDTQCGYRLMHLSAWSELNLRSCHFEIESELLLAFARAGHRIDFVPVQVIYGRERSKIRALRDTWRWWRWWRQQPSGHFKRRPS